MNSASDPAILHTIASYEAGIATLRSAAAGLTHAQLNTRIAPGTWSIQEIIAHILDSDLIATHRMRRIAAEDLPLLVSYDENLFIAKLPSDRINLTTALDLFDANRRFTAQWLRTLTPDAFAREGIHTQRGKVTLKICLRSTPSMSTTIRALCRASARRWACAERVITATVRLRG